MLTGTPVDFESELEQDIALRVGRSWRELRRGAAMGKFREAMAVAGSEPIESGQMDSLDLLVQRDEWRMSELADALRVDPSTATRAVQRLERAGMATRMPCGLDGRVVMVSATVAGRERHDVLATSRRALLASLLGEFELAEREQLADLLDRFVGALDRYVDKL